MKARRVGALAEVAAVEACFLVAAWALQAINPELSGWLSKALMVLLALAGIAAHGRPGEYGLKPRSLKFSAKWCCYVLALFLAAYLAALLAISLAGGRVALNPTGLLKALAWYYLAVGFAEELFFRGYVQSRLNEVFTEKYRRFLGVDFEWTQGTLITAVFLFGLPHLLTGVNPFTKTLRVGPLTVAVTASAVFVGLVAGVLREKTGCVLLPTVLHGSITFTTFSLSSAVGLALSSTTAAAALFVFLAALLEKLLKEPLKD
mgnify:CR=1 FL=1